MCRGGDFIRLGTSAAVTTTAVAQAGGAQSAPVLLAQAGQARPMGFDPADPERDPVWQAMWANRPAITDGSIELSPDPGFGLVLDEAMVRRYRVN